MKVLLLTVLITSIFQVSAFAGPRVLIQEIQRQHIAVSGGELQSVLIAGPSGVEDTRAMVVRSNETSQGILVVVAKSQQGTVLLDGTNQLHLNMNEINTGHRLTSIKGNPDKSFTLRYRSPDGSQLSFNTDITVQLKDEEYVVTSFSHYQRDERTGVYDSCQINLNEGRMVRNEKKSYISKIKLKLSELSDKDLRLYGCDNWKK